MAQGEKLDKAAADEAQIAARNAADKAAASAATKESVAKNAGAQSASSPAAETKDAKGINIGQGENANGEKDSRTLMQKEADAKAAHGHAPSGAKVLREAGVDRTVAAEDVHVVQQGGGGAIVSGGASASVGTGRVK